MKLLWLAGIWQPCLNLRYLLRFRAAPTPQRQCGTVASWRLR